MKKLIFTLLFALTGVAHANPYDFRVLRVIDGDTVEFEATFPPAPLPPKLSIRVLGVDTPEKAPRAQCTQEAEAALKASEFTKQVLRSSKRIQIEIQNHDKYGGRLLGDVIVDGQRLSQMLIQYGHARPYFGEKKGSWCN